MPAVARLLSSPPLFPSLNDLSSCFPLSHARTQMYREGDVVHLVYVARALKPPIEVFHGMPGTAYTFSQPGQHHEVVNIETARRTILHRFLPILQKKNIKYELHLYAENAEASSNKVAEAIIRAGTEDVQPDLVVLAAHNKVREELCSCCCCCRRGAVGEGGRLLVRALDGNAQGSAKGLAPRCLCSSRGALVSQAASAAKLGACKTATLMDNAQGVLSFLIDESSRFPSVTRAFASIFSRRPLRSPLAPVSLFHPPAAGV